MARISGLGGMVFSSLAHITPFTMHDRTTWERLVYAVVDKMEVIVEQYNNLDTISATNMGLLKDAYEALIVEINKAMDVMEDDYKRELAVGLERIKKMIDGFNRTYLMHDPTSGDFIGIDDVLNNVYDMLRVHALTATDMDARELTAEKWDKRSRTAAQIDTVDIPGDLIDPRLSYGGPVGGRSGGVSADDVDAAIGSALTSYATVASVDELRTDVGTLDVEVAGINTDVDALTAQVGSVSATASGAATEAAAAKAAAASLSAQTLRGQGFPEGAVSAPPGTVYIDTTGKSGAWVWLKKTGTGNTGWFVITGDTGWRKLNTLRGSNFTEGDILWRRTADKTILRIVNATLTAGGQITTGTIPAPANLWTGYEGPVQVLRSSATAGILFVIGASGGLGINNITVGSGIYGTLTRQDNMAGWVDVLPGTAA